MPQNRVNVEFARGPGRGRGGGRYGGGRYGGSRGYGGDRYSSRSGLSYADK